MNPQKRLSVVGIIFLLNAAYLCLPVRAQAPRLNVPTNATVLPTETEYTLGAGDRIRITIYQVPEFSGEHLVLVDGSISIPLLGNLNVEGLTITQLNNLLTQKYANFIKNPVITTAIIAPRSLGITITGEVNSPGSYTIPLTPGQKFPNITDLILQAGGITPSADVKNVELRRFIGGRQEFVRVNLWELLAQGNQNQNLTLRDRDTIIVPTATTPNPSETIQLADANFGIRADQELNVSVVGEVFRPGSYVLTPQRTSGDDRTKQQPPRLTRAIQLAGGIRPLANVREVQLRRYPRGGEEQLITINLWELLQEGDLTEDVILQDNDTIIIPTADELPADESERLAIASFAPASIGVNVVGEVRNPGRIEVQPNIPLNQAILAAGGFDQRRAKKGVVELIRLNDNGTVTKKEIEVNFAQGISPENNPILRNNDVVVVNRNGLTAASDTLVTIFSPIGAITGFFNFFNIFGVFDN